MMLFSFVVIAIFTLGGLFFYEYRSVSLQLVSTYGLIAMFFLVVIIDGFLQPIPPDVFVFGVAISGANFFAVVFVAAFASCVGGFIGYQIGKQIGKRKFKKWFGKEHLANGKVLFDKYGAWALIIGAITPIPYSPLCWVLGIYRMNLKLFVFTSFLGRFTRFLIVGLIGIAI